MVVDRSVSTLDKMLLKGTEVRQLTLEFMSCKVPTGGSVMSAKASIERDSKYRVSFYEKKLAIDLSGNKTSKTNK